jgi:hypothetical protein
VPAEELSRALEGLEPDPTWAAEHAARPYDEDFIDPWERAGL